MESHLGKREEKVNGLVGYAKVMAGYLRASVETTTFTSGKRHLC